MSVRIMSTVFDSTLNPTQRLVALALADYASDDGHGVYPSVAGISAKTGLSARSVKEVMKAFRVRGILVEEGERRVRGGRIPVYRIVAEAIPQPGAGGAPGAESVSDPVHILHEPGAPLAPEPSTEPSVKQPTTARRSVAQAISQCSRETNDEGIQLISRLCFLIEGNGARHPNPGVKWYDDARLLLTSDGIRFADAVEVLEWCQADDFWSSVVLSMPKFRAKYDAMKIRMRRGKHPAGNRRGEAASVDEIVVHIEDAKKRKAAR